MMFSSSCLKSTHHVMSQADEIVLQTLMASLNVPQLRKVLKMANRSLKNKDFDSCVCQRCHMHAVNMEDGTEICDSCLAE